ncbi:MAG: hypothetical protein J6U08_05135 [Paludibacteraceae bacterium]|nr:hypothetical protein [Paludibacteraceae bacterium]
MDKKKYLIIIGGILFIMLVLIIFNISNIENLSTTQKEDILKEGNDFYDKPQYENALARYNILLASDSLYHAAEYNKGNTYCQKKRYDLADSTFKNAARKYMMNNPRSAESLEDEFLSKTYHNKGNSNMYKVPPMDSLIMMEEEYKQMNGNLDSLDKTLGQANAQMNARQMFGQNSFMQSLMQEAYKKLTEDLKNVHAAVEDYKNSLRKDSKNDSTRYNLAYAQEYEKRLLDILKDMTPPDNQNQQNQDKNQQNQQNQNQQDQQNQQNQNDKEDERKNTDQQNGEKDQNADLSKENAEQILKAMEKDEENTLKKVRLQRDKNQQRKRIEKNW